MFQEIRPKMMSQKVGLVQLHPLFSSWPRPVDDPTERPWLDVSARSNTRLCCVCCLCYRVSQEREEEEKNSEFLSSARLDWRPVGTGGVERGHDNSVVSAVKGKPAFSHSLGKK